jgi:hypothetical protein
MATAALLGGTDPVYLAGSLLPDLDHIPMAFGAPQAGDPRPNTHSLVVVAALAVVSRRLAAGAAAHLLRDLALDPGVRLFWPLTDRAFRIRYPVYAAWLIAAGLWRAGRDSAARSDVTSAPATGSA